MNIEYPQKIIPVDFENWDSDKAREYLDTTNSGKNIWKISNTIDDLTQQYITGNVFTYFTNQRQKWVKCISPSMTLPGKTIKQITYNIRIQYSKDTKINFKQSVNGKKTWIVKPQKFGNTLGISM